MLSVNARLTIQESILETTIFSLHVSWRQQSEIHRPPLFITVATIPTKTLAGRLRQFSWPGVYYLNPDGMKADVSFLEEILLQRIQPFSTSPVPPYKIHKLARVLATSPKPARDLKRLLDHYDYDRRGWEARLDPILAAPESEARCGHDKDRIGDQDSHQTVSVLHYALLFCVSTVFPFLFYLRLHMHVSMYKRLTSRRRRMTEGVHPLSGFALRLL